MTISVVLRAVGVVICFAIFLKGFFPLKSVAPGYSTRKITLMQKPPSNLNYFEEQLQANSVPALPADEDALKPDDSVFRYNSNDDVKSMILPYKRVVIMVIDALRTDFMFGPQSYMPKTNLLLKMGHGLSYIAETHPPTVTLPRLKAITTGSIPSFIDVLFNFGSTSLTEDNIITQMKISKKKIVFFGDDTWIKLFPNHFERFDGTTSFFVMDYTEVDNNITRHLQKELDKDADWDVMILHYLGLDHIGHFAGPNSPLVRPKLSEMDRIITKIYSALEHWSNSGIPSLLVICGDHGMSDQGGHGGSTPAEISVPVVFLSPLIQAADGIPIKYLPKVLYPAPKELAHHRRTISQTDLCPTLSVLLGLPVPMNNLGKVIIETLGDCSLEQKLSVLHQNFQQVMRVFRNQVKDIHKESAYLIYEQAQQEYQKWLSKKNSSNFHEWEKNGQSILVAYSESLRLMAERVGHLSVQYDVYAMAVAIVLLWLILVSLVISHCNKQSRQPKSSNRRNITLLISIVGTAVMTHITMCTVGVPSNLICSPSLVSVATQVTVAGIFISCLFYILTDWSKCVPLKQQILEIKKKATFAEWFFILSTFVHTLTLTSSSFVEEEHQTFYFLTTSVHFLLMIKFGFHFLKSEKAIECEKSQGKIYSSDMYCNQIHDGITDEDDISHVSSPISSGTSLLIDAEFCKRSKGCTEMPLYEKQTGCENGKNINFSKGSTIAKTLTDKKDCVHLLGSLTVILIVLRVLRRWNQTGDKWLHVPDVGDWLVEPWNKGYLSLAAAFSLLIIGTSRSSLLKRSTTMCVNLSLAFAYMYRAATGSLFFPHKKLLSHTGIAESRASYLFIALTIIISVLPEEFFNFMWKNTLKEEAPKENENILDHSIKSQISPPNREQQPNICRSDITHQDVSFTGHQSEFNLLQKDASVSGRSSSNKNFLSETRICAVNGVMIGWLSLMCLVLRPHNMPVIAMMSLVEQLASHVIGRCNLHHNVILIYCLWMGKTFFFFQGNSNSLSTVDVSAGYVGLEDYNPVLTGLLLAVATYAGPIFWLLTFVKMMFLSQRRNVKRPTLTYTSYFQALTLKLVLPLAVYSALVAAQRHHLFVWTIFSPKLMYQGVETLVIFSSTFITFVFSYMIFGQ